MEKEQFVTIEGKRVPIEGEKNLLELIRKAHFNIVTFCYHPELAAYGACRLCLVEVEGMGIVASCTVAPKDGMKVRVNSDALIWSFCCPPATTIAPFAVNPIIANCKNWPKIWT